MDECIVLNTLIERRTFLIGYTTTIAIDRLLLLSCLFSSGDGPIVFFKLPLLKNKNSACSKMFELNQYTCYRTTLGNSSTDEQITIDLKSLIDCSALFRFLYAAAVKISEPLVFLISLSDGSS